MRKLSFLSFGFILLLSLSAFHSMDIPPSSPFKIAVIDAKNKESRTEVASLGISIEEVHKGYVIGLVSDEQVKILHTLGFHVSIKAIPAFLEDFPPTDADFHNLTELNEELKQIAEKYSNIVSLEVIGESFEKRPLYMIRISGAPSGIEKKPGIIFLGTHHAREHLSTEVPLYLIKHLVENYGILKMITDLIDSREIWIMPMVNPDGAFFDVEGNTPYKWWRKNRRTDSQGNAFGVDLNRNYGYKWGGQGAGKEKESETYRGEAPFSEPETKAVKAFLESHDNITLLLSYHTFSELILYPWGYTDDVIQNEKDLKVYQLLATEMGRMTGYTPQKSSELYITSGDTTDWSYGKLGIFSFTFELYPKSLLQGGFYPSAENIQEVVKNNIPAALYLIDYADNPYRILERPFQIMDRQKPIDRFAVQ